MQLSQLVSFVYWVIPALTFIKVDEDNEETDKITFYAKVKPKFLFNHKQIQLQLRALSGLLDRRIDDFITNGSGWILHSLEFCDVYIGNCKPLLKGFCGAKPFVKKYQDVLNFNEEEEQEETETEDTSRNCFQQAIAYYFLRTGDKNKLNKWVQRNLNLHNISMPVTIADIDKFEKQNEKLCVRINVLYATERGIRFRHKSTKVKNVKETINLVLYNTMVNKKVIPHYACIDNISIFLRSKYENKKTSKSSYSYSKNRNCQHCLKQFRLQKNLLEHENQCLQQATAEPKIIPPKKNETKFENFKNQFFVPYFIVADFEAVTDTSTTQRVGIKEKVIGSQRAICAAFAVINSVGKVVKHWVNTSDNCVKLFLKTLLDIYEELMQEANFYKTYKLTIAEKKHFEESNTCHICKKKFETGPNADEKVVDHEHCKWMDQKYYGPAHRSCNTRRVVEPIIPVYFHNMSSYDGHHLIHGFDLKEFGYECELKFLALNSEKFRSINFNHKYLFLDSFSFLSASIDTISQSLTNDQSFKFPIMSQIFQEKSQRNMLLRKLTFPYDYIKNIGQMKRVTKFPSQDVFFNKLTQEMPSEEKYQNAKSVWECFKIKNMLEFTSIYCLADTLLLGEALHRFRMETYDSFGLDVMAGYISLPQFTMDAMLKYTGVVIKNMTNVNMQLWTEKSIRGGLGNLNYFFLFTLLYLFFFPVHVASRYANNNPASPNKEVHIFDIDANNLYGMAMMGPLPIGGYEFLVNESKIKSLLRDLYNNKMEENCEYGTTWEIDAIVPEHLHEKLHCYPIAPEKLDIDFYMLSPYAQDCYKKIYNSSNYDSCKLTATLGQKNNYIVHWKVLQTYLQLGLIITKVHNVLQYRQKAFLKPYIEYCTTMRAQSTSEFTKRRWKLMCNAVSNLN